ncbi:MAG: acyl-CoA dehydrogenase family protein, partial [Porticoccaceae bacterium]
MTVDIKTYQAAIGALDNYVEQVHQVVADATIQDGKLIAALVDQHQRMVHGYAWITSTATALTVMLRWAESLEQKGCLRQVEQLSLKIAFGEYLGQILGGLAMGQNEIVRPADFGLEAAATELAKDSAVTQLLSSGNTAENRLALAQLCRDGVFANESLDDDFIDAARDQYRRYTEERIIPQAHQWHLDNALIPDQTVDELAAMGTFGICIPEDFGGLGLGKLAMSVVTEELSRGWIAAGSLGTRSEIAGELILLGGTKAQHEQWLPGIASGEVLPTAVFTEPDVGSDMGSLTTRALSTDNGWQIKGNKTWITHASRSDLMTLMARSLPDKKGYAGLSMFLVPKPRGTEEDPFPSEGLSGTEIEVLGYRGMREYELAFDDFELNQDALLGGEQGNGFKQLMKTFEGARIQTAARAVGVARRALELGLSYALDRKQFNQSLFDFPRVSDKIAMMAVDTLLAREITYFAAREKDKGHRCDIEAGMAKLLAARAAWTSADASL